MNTVRFHNNYAHETSGRHYNFSSPLESGIFFSIIPDHPIPYNSVPIMDEDEGLCIGYAHKNRSSLIDIYDYNGEFINRYEPPLESPLIDPLDIIFLGPIILKCIRFGFKSLKVIANRNTIIRGSSFISQHWINILHGRMKWGLSAKNLKFSATPAKHMQEPGRYVPVRILEIAIRYGKRSPDKIGKSKIKLMNYQIKIRKNKVRKGKVNGFEGSEIYETHDYLLTVVVNEADWTIAHFIYDRIK